MSPVFVKVTVPATLLPEAECRTAIALVGSSAKTLVRLEKNRKTGSKTTVEKGIGFMKADYTCLVRDVNCHWHRFWNSTCGSAATEDLTADYSDYSDRECQRLPEKFLSHPCNPRNPR
jgi:hypothetical protein